DRAVRIDGGIERSLHLRDRCLLWKRIVDLDGRDELHVNGNEIRDPQRHVWITTLVQEAAQLRGERRLLYERLLIGGCYYELNVWMVQRFERGPITVHPSGAGLRDAGITERE